ncbi:tol-pal system YbgF family protein [Kribbella sp. NPDC048928]|uniref:tetratricopeptide repeat protein n=1 Tax=Kribbella sp. NPDC048928 TaxID=3364111 RepID=UPI00371A04F9
MTELAAVALANAAAGLMRAGQWTAATDLLTAAHTDDPAERSVLALALADVAVDHDFGRRTDHARAALDAISDDSWDLELLKVRQAYAAALFQSGDRAVRSRALALIEDAPDDGRRGTAHFWAGAIADNLDEQPAEAIEHYTAALELGEKSDDEPLIGQALRHLGYHAHLSGDLALARSLWERSTELLQKVGHLRPALAQQASLATLLRDEGDVAGSRALATEVNRWARQLDVQFIIQETEDLMAPRTPQERPR